MAFERDENGNLIMTYTDDEILRLDTLDSVNKIDLTFNNIKLLERQEILFIVESSEESIFFDKKKNYYIRNKYHKDVSDEDIYIVFPELNLAKENHKKSFNAINLGMGHALLIRKEIYSDYMKILRKCTKYENEFEDFYNAWNYWLYCAIKYIDIYLKEGK